MIGNLEPEERVLDMGNSPTDKSKDFIRSGMTLITQIDSEKHLKKVEDDRRKDTSETSRDNTWYLAKYLSPAGKNQYKH